MSGDEEVLDDFPMRDSFTTAEYLVGAYRAESTNETSKIPPSDDGTTSWFKYEELVQDWLDLTVLGTSKQGSSTEEQAPWTS